MRRLALLLLPVLLLGACTFGAGPAVNPDPNHTHADFAVYVEGRKLDFSAEKYMSVPPADAAAFFDFLAPAAHAHEAEDEGEHIAGREYLHLHDGNGSVIHRHKPGLTLGDFFFSIGFHMDEHCLTLDDGTAVCTTGEQEWQMFVNGALTSWNPAYVFQDLDRILLTYAATEEQVRQQLAALSNDACLYSKTCPERGDPPYEGCIADPLIPCTQ